MKAKDERAAESPRAKQPGVAFKEMQMKDDLQKVLDEIRAEDQPTANEAPTVATSPPIEAEVVREAVSIPMRMPLGTAPGGRNALAIAAFGQSPEERLKQAQDAMGRVERYFFNRPLKALDREHYTKIAKALLDGQFETSFQKIALAVDIEKKNAFVAYMKATATVRRDLFALDAAARGEVAHMLQSIDEAIFRIRSQGEGNVRSLVSKGLITSAEADGERRKYAELCREQLEASLKTLRDLWENHRQLLEHTLNAHLGMSQEVAALD